MIAIAHLRDLTSLSKAMITQARYLRFALSPIGKKYMVTHLHTFHPSMLNAEFVFDF